MLSFTARALRRAAASRRRAADVKKQNYASQGTNMNWFYESGGSQQGPVSEAELDRLLAEGKITGDTLVWREGMAGWMPHRSARPAQVAPPNLDYEVTRPGTPLAQSTAAPVSPAPTPLGSSAGGSDAPQPGWIRCSYTGRYFPPSDIIYIEGRPYSAAAKPQVLASLTSGQALPGTSGDRTGPAWEQRETLGWVKAIVETVKSALLQPAACFSTMRREGGLGTPLTYSAVVAGAGLALNYLYQFMFQGAFAAIFSSMGQSASQARLQMGMGVAMSIVMIIFSPLLAVVGTLINAGITHLCLMLFKGANYPFEVTARVSSYAFSSAMVLYAIPFCGGYVGAIWGIVIMCIGLAKAHECTTDKAVGAVLLPMGVCCVAAVILVMVFGFSAAAASGAFR